MPEHDEHRIVTILTVLRRPVNRAQVTRTLPNESRLSGGRPPASHTTPALPQVALTSQSIIEPGAAAGAWRDRPMHSDIHGS